MKRFSLLVICFLFVAGPLFAEVTIADINGNDWTDLSDNAKKNIVSGYCHAVIHSGKYTRDVTKGIDMIGFCSEDVLQGTNVLQIKEGLDSFYSDFRNKHIPLNNAIYVVCKAIKGVTKEEIERDINQFRNPNRDYFAEEIEGGK